MSRMDLPLVSVVVATYNSSKTIIETLESIMEQSYDNLELVITDDCSKDDTVDVCQKWLDTYQHIFKRAILLKSSRNTGVSANFNRGISESKGTWIKSIAGDDTLTKDCISSFMEYVMHEKDCRICLCYLRVFGIDESDCRKTERWLETDLFGRFENLPREEQYHICLYHHIMPGPAIFYQKSLWEEIGGFNEDYPGTEEYPFEIAVLRITRFHLIKKYLVNWRARRDSLSRSKVSRAHDDDRKIFYEIRRPLLVKEGRFLEAWDHTLWYLIRDKMRVHKWKRIYMIIMFLSPLWIKKMIKKYK